VLALFARFTFHGGAGVYAGLTSLMGGGAVAGGLLIATRNRPDIHRLTAIGTVFGLFILAVAVAPDLPAALVLIFPMGAASIAFIATANATLQLRAEPTMRGRVMALYAIAFLGTTPIGSPLVGWISQTWSPRVALAVGGTATIVASVIVRRHHRQEHLRTPAVPPVVDEAEPGTELGVA
ncbi:MAG: MFS transporter, partial [Acidimicrobiales bacterium]